MECKDDAKIVYGFKDNVTANNLKEAINDIENTVKYIDVHKGDFISIPAGTIHAIMDGILLCEVQQSSDVTYRVYDWNRRDKNGNARELHKDKALAVINLENDNGIHNYSDINVKKSIYESNIFNIDMIKVDGNTEEISKSESFYAYIVIEGMGNIETSNFSKNIKMGDTFLIPASLGNYTISGKMKIMKINV